MSKSKKNRSAKPAPQAPVLSGEALETQAPATVETAATQDSTQTEGAKPEAPVSKPRRPAGLGYPNAKKLINPQQTLELKKEAAKKLGGSMIYQNKNWIIKVPVGEFKIPSRVLAGLSLATFLEHIQKEPVVTQVAAAEEVAANEETDEEAVA
jgi:hypothetical protein